MKVSAYTRAGAAICGESPVITENALYLWKGHDAVPGEIYAMQKSVADCPVNVEGMHSAE